MPDNSCPVDSSEQGPILAEIRRVLGFVPPLLGAVASDPVALRSLWQASKSGYVDNALPALFKERFLAIIAKYRLAPHSLVVRCCVLSRLGEKPAAILELLSTPLPKEAAIEQGLRASIAGWTHDAGWGAMPRELERWVLFAAARLALRRDRRSLCRELLREILGQRCFNRILLIAAYAEMQRVWAFAHPDPLSDEQIKADYDRLLKDAPELSKLWEKIARKISSRRTTRRERKLMAEIGRQDRIREALRRSEHRFRRIVQNAPFPVMIYTEEGQVLLLNRAWEELSGWDRKAIPDVQTWMKIAQVDRTDWSPQDVEALRGWDGVIEEGEQRIRTRDGQVRQWSFSTAALGPLEDGRRAIMRIGVDVSERRELEDALWDTNRRMVSFLDAITDGFVAMDQETRFLYANQKLIGMFGMGREELVGRQFGEVFPYAINMPLYHAIERCLKQKTTEHIEHYSPRADTFYEVHLYPSEEGLSAFIRDIGQRKRMEQQLRASERRFRGLFESDMLGIMFANRFTGAVLDCNKAFLRMTGYSREDLEKGRLNWIQLTAPEHRAFDVSMSHQVGNGPLAPYEKVYISKDGRRIPVLIGGAPITPGEDVVMAFVVDRTEQQRLERQSEQRRRNLDALVRGAPLAMAIIDRNGIVELWNPAAEKMFGWSAEEAVGRFLPIVREEKRAAYLESICKVMGGEEFPELPRKVCDRAGTVKEILVKALPARDENGEIIGAIALMRSMPAE